MAPQAGDVGYAKLRSGAWGLRAMGELTPGETVTVTKKNGEQKTETVGRHEVTLIDHGVHLYAIETGWRCGQCGPRTRAQVRQVERDEVCLYACRACGSTVDEAAVGS